MLEMLNKRKYSENVFNTHAFSDKYLVTQIVGNCVLEVIK